MSSLNVYELGEIHRSAIDASRPRGSLAAKPSQLTRYANPAADTAYPLEYAFHLLGDIQDKTVLEYGCGDGENTLQLASRGARVIGIDISPDLLQIAQYRLSVNHVSADLRAVSGYDTAMPDASADVVFCIAVLHHLDLEKARQEALRVLKPGGVLILQEPMRDSRTYAFLRGLIPYSPHDISDFERPLRSNELDGFSAGMECEAKRRFRLPFVSVAGFASPWLLNPAFVIDHWLLTTIPFLEHWATIEVRKLRKV